MPADLDELFVALGRQADALPLGPATEARRRGERRRRHQVMAAAVAVLLVIASAGAAGWWIDHERRPVLPAGTIRGLVPVGDPVPLPGSTVEGGHATWVGGGRVFLSVNQSVQAVDARTGKPLWSTGPFQFADFNDGPVPYAGSLLMLEGAPPTVLRVHDQVSGARRWTLPLGKSDSLLVHDRLLIRMVAATGVTEAFEISTGRKRWSAAPGGDRPVRIAGMQNSADGMRLDGQPEPGSWRRHGIQVSGDRLVQLTRGGRLLMLDAGTGKLLQEVRGPKLGLSAQVYAIDGAAITLDEGRVRTTGLSDGPGVTRVLYDDARVGARLVFPCGSSRLCVTGMALMAVIDSHDGRVLWTASSKGIYRPPVSARGDRTLTIGINEAVLHDENGRQIFTTDETVGWIDEGNLLYLDQEAIHSVSTADGKVTRLGDAPTWAGRCGWNAELLACPALLDGSSRTELRIWRFTR